MAVTANCISAMTPPANVAPPEVLTPLTDWACVFCAAELGGLFPGGAADRGLVPPVPNEKFRALEMRKPAASYTARSWNVPPGRGV